MYKALVIWTSSLGDLRLGVLLILVFLSIQHHLSSSRKPCTTTTTMMFSRLTATASRVSVCFGTHLSISGKFLMCCITAQTSLDSCFEHFYFPVAPPPAECKRRENNSSSRAKMDINRDEGCDSESRRWQSCGIVHERYVLPTTSLYLFRHAPHTLQYQRRIAC